MKFIHRKPSANFPQTPVWGITATKWAVVISFDLHSVVIELPRRKLTQPAPDAWESADLEGESTPEVLSTSQTLSTPTKRR